MTDEAFQTVFDLLETGYRGQTWGVILGLLLVLGVIYVVRLKPQTSGDRLYRYCVVVVLVTCIGGYGAYQFRTYGQYRELAAALERGETETTVGHISFVWSDGHYQYFDVDGRRMRGSRYEWPYWLGFHPGSFPLRPTFLVKVDQVDDVVVRLQVHRVHLGQP